MGERAIIVVPHDPVWPAHFAAEQSRLQTLLSDVAEAYGRLKMNVAASCNNDIDLYCAGKEEFVNRTERAAIAWRASTR